MAANYVVLVMGEEGGVAPVGVRPTAEHEGDKKGTGHKEPHSTSGEERDSKMRELLAEHFKAQEDYTFPPFSFANRSQEEGCSLVPMNGEPVTPQGIVVDTGCAAPAITTGNMMRWLGLESVLQKTSQRYSALASKGDFLGEIPSGQLMLAIALGGKGQVKVHLSWLVVETDSDAFTVLLGTPTIYALNLRVGPVEQCAFYQRRKLDRGFWRVPMITNLPPEPPSVLHVSADNTADYQAYVLAVSGPTLGEIRHPHIVVQSPENAVDGPECPTLVVNEQTGPGTEQEGPVIAVPTRKGGHRGCLTVLMAGVEGKGANMGPSDSASREQQPNRPYIRGPPPRMPPPKPYVPPPFSLEEYAAYMRGATAEGDQLAMHVPGVVAATAAADAETPVVVQPHAEGDEYSLGGAMAPPNLEGVALPA